MRITDTLIAPFEIEADSDQYTVVRKTGTVRTTKTGEQVENEQTVGHYISLSSALKKIAKEQVLSEAKDTTTLKEFVAALEIRDRLFTQNILF